MYIALTYQQAVDHATSGYWVKPITFAPGAEGAELKFEGDYVIADYSDDGKEEDGWALVHYVKQ